MRGNIPIFKTTLPGYISATDWIGLHGLINKASNEKRQAASPACDGDTYEPHFEQKLRFTTFPLPVA